MGGAKKAILIAENLPNRGATVFNPGSPNIKDNYDSSNGTPSIDLPRIQRR